jgi:2-polyprenyl-3-methyl-5-hydroxy-6-metoxy-1,4-benzoquinol methylase
MSVKTFSTQPARHERSAEVRCGVCGAAEYSLKWERPEYRFVRCKGCGVLYQNPQPAAGDLAERYDEAYFRYERENESAFFDLMSRALEDVRFFREVEPRFGKGLFLDVGCATGRLLEELRGRGWRVEGVEVCLPSAEFARRQRGLNVHTVPLEEAKLPSEGFDVIHASHLIEHVPKPGDFIAETARLLTPEGRLILTTPNSGGFQARMFGEGWRSLIPDHVYLFSRASLRRLLMSHGFEVEREKTWGGLARGLAPEPLKRIADGAAKRFAFGDVMVMRAKKRAV